MNMDRMATSLLVVLLGMAQSAWSDTASNTSEYPEWARQGGRCHYLMTGAECTAFQRVLGTTPSTEERERLLAENQLLLREREASCSCRHEQRSAARAALLRQAMRGE